MVSLDLKDPGVMVADTPRIGTGVNTFPTVEVDVLTPVIDVEYERRVTMLTHVRFSIGLNEPAFAVADTCVSGTGAEIGPRDVDADADVTPTVTEVR